MEASIIREYRRFRANDPRLSASFALGMARTITEWEVLEAQGVVKIEAEEDSEPYDFGNLLDDMNEREAEEYKEKVLSDGVFGVVGSFKCSCCGNWEESDSVWSCAGYNDVLSPLENYYVPDIMAQTIEAYKKSKGGD